ncbi:pentatricopeptide repeat-containing protein [Pyrus ussuriensis x Pyrus communis]|uniref:Pentatricopeptide repeat-containing protein n=1 Tax=Pyrus ussuriensis x Pyrus communis TaxID=2448454 RepID=A0A5N5I6H4_9ROSA|nr:pentatricopeptide repeat-containing protein [Pyrus ussuriensis x Pyrus communis]
MANSESLLQKCTSLARIKQLQAHLLTSGKFQFYPSLTAKLLERCALSPVANLPYATALFHRLQNPSTNQWNAVFRRLAQSPQPTQGIAWYKTMSQASQKVDALTCSFVLKACARALAFTEAMQIHSQIVKFGFGADVLLRTTLLDVYAKVGNLEFALKVFDELGQRDTACWNALISGLAQGNRPTEAIALFQRMSEEEDLKPNEVTVLGALSTCSQLGALKRGEKVHAYIMDEKLDMHVIVCNAHYGTVVDLLGRAGRIQEAYEIINYMPMIPDVVLWQTLLGASKTYRNVEMAELASQKLIEMGSEGCGDFVLLLRISREMGRCRQGGGGHEEKRCEEDTGFWLHRSGRCDTQVRSPAYAFRCRRMRLKGLKPL